MDRVTRDAVRVFLLMVVTGALLYWLDTSNVVIYQAVMIALFQVGSTHLTRRILFPHLDLQAIAKKAVVDNSIAAAIVFASVIVFLIAVMFLSTQVFK